ncbi:hypothetical protein AJ79_00395 [Helicocarpus griseus UAMH5409]|uniref:Uncharacterized protein n=1 Tax=Helicocarpus griseus UAMH5409 TaxID=1447875 RepID=A0A2B7YAQ5_9EURO|nr:hypothetical protein AJ79_00395 [Helicocarpus griseus UAMH5409]
MCDYKEVEHLCGHKSHLVYAWCVVYQQSHKRCPPNVIIWEQSGKTCST